jgi:hypothetical protein
MANDGHLYAGTWYDGPHVVSTALVTCRTMAWNGAGDVLLLRCGQSFELRAYSGATLARATLPPGTTATPLDGNGILEFRSHGMWKWSRGNGERLALSEADPV